MHCHSVLSRNKICIIGFVHLACLRAQWATLSLLFKSATFWEAGNCLQTPTPTEDHHTSQHAEVKTIIIIIIIQQLII